MDETFLNDILECSVCLEQLDTSSKVLPCQHTFCRRCLEEIVNSHKELRCPECRVLVDTKVEDLPCNILLIRLLEGIKNNSRFTRNSNTGNDTLGRRLEVSSCGSSGNQTIPHSPHVMTPRQLRYQPGSCDGQLFPKQVVQPIPCAKALYPYEAKEPGDLSFKKGDIIVLRKRIDQNWYSGEVGGKHGFFPASYVQVLIPIPVAFPQCKALYDFRLSTECDEKDCLIFSKGEIITVIRRVDENWAEGKLGDRIGIFPISFVEMNSAARALMKLSSNLQGGPSRIAPPIPISKGAQVSGQPVTTSASSSAASMGQDSMSSNTTTPSPTSSSSSPSPGTPCSSSSTSISPPSLPQPTVLAAGLSTSQAVPAQGRMANSHQKEKRHSLSALSFSQNSPQSTASYRHSMEVLIGSTTDSTFGSDSQNKGPGPQTPVSNVLVPPTVPTQWAESTGARIVRHHSGRRERNTGNSTPQKETSETESGSSNGIPTSSSHGPSNTHVPVPIFYVAVYNYKPHKEDELELKKGELYTVCEKCQDGWFKGTSLRTGRSGVFPGNYVQLPKTSSLQPHFPQGVPPAGSMKLPASKIVSVSSPPMPVSTTTAQAMQSQSFCSSGNGSKPSGSYLNNPRSKHTESRCGILVGLREWTQSLAGIAPPPQHLPRPQPSSRNGISAVQKIKTSNGNAPKALVGATRHTEWDVAAAPMAASYPVSSTGRTQSLPTSGSITLSWYNTNQNNGHQRSTPLVSLSAATAVTPPNVCIGVPAGESSDGASTGNTRSEKKEKKEREKVSLVKRLTSKRKSKSPPPSNYCDNPTFVDTPLTTTGATQIQAMHVRSGSCPSKALGGHQVSHKKSNSLDVNNADHAKPSSRPRQPAPLVRERFRCIVPYPPNSELELELKVGDIVYVHKKREDGWYKGTLQRTGKTGLFPGSFVESF